MKAIRPTLDQITWLADEINKQYDTLTSISLYMIDKYDELMALTDFHSLESRIGEIRDANLVVNIGVYTVLQIAPRDVQCPYEAEKAGNLWTKQAGRILQYVNLAYSDLVVANAKMWEIEHKLKTLNNK